MSSLPAHQVAFRRTLAVWLLVLATLAWVPGGFTRFTFAKLAVVSLALVLTATIPALGRVPRRLAIALFIGLGVFVLVSLVGDTPQASLVGRWPRYEGLPVLALYGGCVWAGARLTGPTERGLARLQAPLAAMSIVLALASALEALGLSPLGRATLTRTGSLLGNATDQGLVAMMAAAVLLPVAVERRAALPVAGLLGALVTLGLSGSRASLAACALALGLQIVVRLRGQAARASLALAGLLVAALALPQTRDRLLSGHSVHGRVLEWEMTARLVGDHPLVGVGPSRFVDAVGRYETADWARWSGGHTLDSPHSWPLQALASGGLLLLVAALVVAGLVARSGWRAASRSHQAFGVATAVAAYAVALLLNFTAAGSTCLAAVLVGVLVAQPPGQERETHRRVKLVAAGAALVLTATAAYAEIPLREGVVAAAAGDVDRAQTAFDSAARVRFYDDDVQMIAAQSLAGLASNGDATAAAAARERARLSLRTTPESYESRVALGVALLGEKQPAEAVAQLTEAITTCPRRAAAYVQRGVARAVLGRLGAARRDLRRALAYGPDAIPLRLLRQLGDAPTE